MPIYICLAYILYTFIYNSNYLICLFNQIFKLKEIRLGNYCGQKYSLYTYFQICIISFIQYIVLKHPETESPLRLLFCFFCRCIGK